MSSIDPAGASLALKARIMAQAAATPSPTRRRGRRAARLVLVASLAAGVAFFELAGGLAHSRDRPLVSTVRLADGWALGSAALTWLTARFGTPFVRSAEALRAACMAAPAALVLWMSYFRDDSPGPASADAWACVAASIACALVPLAGFLWARRQSEPRHPATMGAAMGAASGGWAGVLGLLRCPHSEPMHAFFAHALPLALTTLAGALVGARVLGMRRYRRGLRSPSICEPRSAPRPASTAIGRM